MRKPICRMRICCGMRSVYAMLLLLQCLFCLSQAAQYANVIRQHWLDLFLFPSHRLRVTLLAGLLEPLPVNASNFRERLDSLLAAMGADILGRVVDDKLEENRRVMAQAFAHPYIR